MVMTYVRSVLDMKSQQFEDFGYSIVLKFKIVFDQRKHLTHTNCKNKPLSRRAN